jgi:hypothetical protein
MTDEEEFAARSKLKWTRDGDVWILLYRRRRMGRVTPSTYPLNMSRAKDLVLAQAVREVAYELACKSGAKPQQIRGSNQKKSSPIDLSA